MKLEQVGDRRQHCGISNHFASKTAAAIVALLAFVVAPASPALAQTAVQSGFRDFSFGNDVSTPTSEKPESKLWWNDGSWWGVLYNDSANQYRIYRFDSGSQSWTDTGTVVDNRSSSRADVLWDTEAQRLYVVSHVFSSSGSTTTNSSQWGRLSRFSYNSTTRTYTLEAGFPVNVTRGKSETLTIAKDANQRLWVTFVEGRKVKVNWSLTSDLDWGVPVDLPVGNSTAITVDSDDISAIVNLPSGDVGVMWSNQDTRSVYFSVHRSVDPLTTWQPIETVLPNPGCSGSCADDHINLKTDQAGRVFAVLKTSLDDDETPLIILAVRDTNETWSLHTVALAANNHTRPIVLLDEESRTIYVFATHPESGGGVYMKTSSLDNIQFDSGVGEEFIFSSTDTKTNNPTSTKQNVNSTTGLLVVASDQSSNFYLHNYLPLGGGTPQAPQAPLNLVATAVSSTRVDLSWTDASSNETEFHVERRIGSSGPFSPHAIVSANVTTYSDTTNVLPDTTYNYQVKARNAVGDSGYSNIAQATTPPVVTTAPSAPTDLQATAVSSSRVDLSWQDTSNNEEFFDIERAIGGGGFVPLVTVAANVESYSDSTVSPDMAYSYKVKARNAVGSSGYSNVAAASTPPAPDPGAIKSITFEDGFLVGPVTGADSTKGTVQLETALPLKGTFSARIPNAGSSFLEEKFTPAGDLYVSFYVRLAALPASDVRLALISSSGDSTGLLLLLSSGRLRLRFGSTTIGDSQPLVPGQLYRIGLHQKAGSGNAVLEAFVASGDASFTAPFAATTTGSWVVLADRLRVGATTNAAVNVVVDDIILATTAMPGPSVGPGMPPNAPTGLTATAVSSGQVHLSWTDNSNNETAFRIERGPAGSSDSDFVLIDTVGTNATSYNDTTVGPNTSYDYRVLSAIGTLLSTPSNTASVTTPPAAAPPNAPTGLNTTAVTATRVDLSWTDNSTNETTFHIQRAPLGSTAFTEIDTVGANVENYSDTDVDPEMGYRYRVYASNGQGDSAFSNIVDVTTPPAPTAPSAPTSLTAQAVTSTQVNLSWTDTSSNETAFHIYRRLAGGSTFSEIATVGADATSYSDTNNVTPNTGYEYQVRAGIDGTLLSEPSNTASVTTPPAAGPPMAPTELNATAVSATRVDLSWKDNSSDETTFHIERAEGSGDFVPLDTVGPNIAAYSDLDVEPETSYRYQVYASNGQGDSGFSNIAQVTTPPAGGAGVIKMMTFENGSLTDPDTGADSINGTVLLETAAPLKGLAAARVPGTSGSFLNETFTPASDLYVSFYFRLTALPSADVRIALVSNDGESTGILLLRNTGRLRLRAQSINVGTESAPLTPGQLYRIGLHQKAGTGGNAVLEGFIAVGDDAFGAPFASTSTGSWTTSADRLRLGTTTGSGDLVFDDVALSTVAMPGPSVAPSAPSAPTALQATAVGSTQVDLTWADNSSNEAEFIIERAEGSAAFLFVAAVGANTTTYSDMGLNANTSYRYRVKARNPQGDSEYSDEAQVTTGSSARLTDSPGIAHALTFEIGNLVDQLVGADNVRGTAPLEGAAAGGGLYSARVPGTASSYPVDPTVDETAPGTVGADLSE